MAGLIRAHRGLRPKIAADAFIAETAVVIGDVEIGAGSSIWYGCVLRGDVTSGCANESPEEPPLEAQAPHTRLAMAMQRTSGTRGMRLLL